MVIQIKNGIMINVNMSVKSIAHAKKFIVAILAHVFFHDAVILGKEIANVMDSAVTNVTNTISTNARSTVTIKPEDKNVRQEIDCYILHAFLLVTILPFMIAIFCYHNAKHKSNQKDIGELAI